METSAFTHRSWRRLVTLVVGASFAAVAADAGSSDGGGLPVGWFVAGKAPQHYRVESLPAGTCGGSAASVASAVAAPQGNVSVMQVFRADKYRGMRVRFSATVTTKDVSGWAGLWMRVDGPQQKTLAFDNMQARPLRGTTGCGVQAVVLEVAQSAEVIALGLVVEGTGSAQLSGIDLEAVDDSVPTTDLVAEARDARSGAAIGRVGSVWFTDRIVNRQDTNVQLKLVAPGKWSDRAGDYTASVEGDRVMATALDLTQPQPLALSGEFRFRRDGDATLIEGTWGTAVKKHPVSIRFSRTAVDLTWGFYERHLKVEKAPQLAAHCVYYAQWASPTRRSDELQVCGVVFDADAPRVQTVLAFVLSGFRRLGTGLPLDEAPVPPKLPSPQPPPPAPGRP